MEIIKGHIADIRDFGKLKFLIVRQDGNLIQIVLKKEVVDDELLEKVKDLTKESVVEISGEKVESPKAPNGFEIIPKSIEIISKSDPILPIDLSGKIESNLDTILDTRPVSLRLPKYQKIFRVVSDTVYYLQEYLRKNNFTQIFTPCILTLGAEGGSEVFNVFYYGKEAYLRQDPQLHRQLAIQGGFSRVFEIGPNWRAEESHTTRHMSEYRGIAVEMGFIKNEYDIMEFEEKLIRYIIEKLSEKYEIPEILLPSGKFPVLEFPEIYEIIEREFGKVIEFGEDLDREAEKMLAQYVREKYKSDFFFVNRFAFQIKPFYVMRCDEDSFWARSTDLLFKGLEISSGGQREHRYEKIIENIKEKDLNLDELKWFTEIFKYGSIPHGGFGIGLERFVTQLLNLENIREASMFPRDTDRYIP
jgi:aspartyl-tRNA synthetase